MTPDAYKGWWRSSEEHGDKSIWKEGMNMPRGHCTSARRRPTSRPTAIYLARADIMWAELRARDIKLDDLETYVTLRGSQLTPDDKKRVLMEVDAANTGKLTISKAAASIRMLGATFFHEMTGQRRARGKTYDQGALLAEHQEPDQDDSHPAMVMDHADEIPEDEIMETLLQEGDDDATLVADFEGTATDVIQSDPELASALTAYTEARRRLSEKFRSRGFWPPSFGSKGKSKGGHRGPKGKFGKQNHQRKSVSAAAYHGVSMPNLQSVWPLEGRMSPEGEWNRGRRSTISSSNLLRADLAIQFRALRIAYGVPSIA